MQLLCVLGKVKHLIYNLLNLQWMMISTTILAIISEKVRMMIMIALRDLFAQFMSWLGQFGTKYMRNKFTTKYMRKKSLTKYMRKKPEQMTSSPSHSIPRFSCGTASPSRTWIMMMMMMIINPIMMKLYRFYLLVSLLFFF